MLTFNAIRLLGSPFMRAFYHGQMAAWGFADVTLADNPYFPCIDTMQPHQYTAVAELIYQWERGFCSDRDEHFS